jgi:hypothetical protein
MRINRLFAFAFAACLAGVARAQLPGPGLTWSGSSANSAGSYLPSCANLPVTGVRGETVTLRVWGDQLAPFALFAAGSGNQCLPVPGLGNALILDPPLVTITFGVLTMTSPCLSCPPGLQQLVFTIPQVVPQGTTVSLQAASLGAGVAAFTVAITATVS